MRKLLTFTVLLLIWTCSLGADSKENVADSNEYLDGKNGPVCVSAACVRAASVVLKNLDETVEPCDNFYDFACGGYIKDTVIPDDKPGENYFNQIDNKIKEQLRTILEEPPKSDEPKPFTLVKQYYNSCINTKEIENDGLKTMQTILKELGGWPVIEGPSWKGDKFDWKKTTYDFGNKGYDTKSLIKVFVAGDAQNSSQRIIAIDQASLGLDREYLIEGFKNEVVQAYLKYMVDVAVILGAEEKLALKEMKEAVEFEMKLANISLPKEERRNASLLTNPMEVSELQERYPSIPWQDYLNHLVGVGDIIVCPHDKVDVGVLKYVSDLEKLLAETPKRVQANYLLTQAVIDSVTYLTKQLRAAEQEFDSVQQGTQSKEPRWKECAALAANKMGIATGALYARRFFSNEAKRTAEELIFNLRATFRTILKEVDWMDEGTKKIALEKAQAMESHVAYPQELLDDKKIEKYYSELEPNPASFLEFTLSIDKFADDVNYKKLPEVVNKTDWTEHSDVTTVNAYYNSVENSILLTAGILQGVFFDYQRPRYMNYGSIGFAIGHEITHGFDDQGRQYDKDGNLKDWWAQKTNEAFLEKAQCIIDQYGNCTVPEVKMNLNGINTQGENIADNGGIKEAYLAYNLWAKRNGEEPLLPGLKYSQRQLFWISVANVWCEKQRTEYLRQQVLVDPHSPPNFRVIVPLSNTDYFAKDFNCPKGSKMNPEHKCHVW